MLGYSNSGTSYYLGIMTSLFVGTWFSSDIVIWLFVGVLVLYLQRDYYGLV